LTGARAPSKLNAGFFAHCCNLESVVSVMAVEREKPSENAQATEKEIAALQQGSMAAFENLFRQWKDPVYAYVLRMVADDALAHDITQDVFLRVMRAASTYDHRGRLRQWLFTIASNLVTDHARRLKRRREFTVEEPAVLADTQAGDAFVQMPVEAFASAELREVLEKALDELPREQRTVLLLRQYGDLTFKEIAALEGCSINTALSRMRYALGNLRKVLAQTFTEVGKDEVH
jgi:RNA polymerase sigma-70 factor (ECF subfamily)